MYFYYPLSTVSLVLLPTDELPSIQSTYRSLSLCLLCIHSRVFLLHTFSIHFLSSTDECIYVYRYVYSRLEIPRRKIIGFTSFLPQQQSVNFHLEINFPSLILFLVVLKHKCTHTESISLSWKTLYIYIYLGTTNG